MTRTARLGRSLDRRDAVGSTMDECAAAWRAGAPDGHVVLARLQTAGRGRTGRTWHSADEGGLYPAVLLRGLGDPGRAAGLTLAAGVGVLDAVRALGVARAGLKWPNDVLVGERKLAGILAEWLGDGAAVVGIGLNVAQRGFPPDLAPLATSIALETGSAPSLDAALDELLAHLESAIDAFRRGGLGWVVPEWSARCGLWGRRARAAGVTGTMLRLDPTGALVVRTDDGRTATLAADAVELA